MGTWTEGEPPDAIRLVREGYDAIGVRYLRWSCGAIGGDAKERYVDRIVADVAPGARVLDVGCGPGEPVLRRLSDRCRAIGADLSAAQLMIASRRCVGTSLVQADLVRGPFRTASFDAVVCLYVLLHVPATAHPTVFGSLASWLRPGGRCYLCTGTRGGPGGVEEGWLGAPMYFGGVDTAETLRLARAAGLEVESAEVVEQLEDDEPHSFLWLVARRPLEVDGPSASAAAVE